MNNLVVRSKYVPIPPEQLRTHSTLYAERAWPGASNRYTFLSTGKVLDRLADHGFQPYALSIQRTNVLTKQGFTKHSLRLRPDNYAPAVRVVGDVFPEIILTNSHDSGSSYSVEAGFFRLACLNGMTVSAGYAQRATVRHVGVTVEDVLEATYKVVDSFPAIVDARERFNSLTMPLDRQIRYAELAAGLRWEAEKMPFQAAHLLSTRRYEDQGNSLWTVFNRVQENLLSGQRRGFDRNLGRRIDGTRALTGITATAEINRGLWQLTEEFSKELAPTG